MTIATEPNWQDKNLPSIQRRDLFLKSKPTDAEWENHWPKLQRAAHAAAVAEGKKRLDAACAKIIADGKEARDDDHERIFTLRHDLATGRFFNKMVQNRQFEHRVILDASHPRLKLEALRGLCRFMIGGLEQKWLGTFDEVLIVRRGAAPGGIFTEDYVGSRVGDVVEGRLIILLPDRDDEHFALTHQVAHMAVALAWQKRGKPALFWLDGADRTDVWNLAEALDRGDRPGWGGAWRVTPDPGLRLHAAAHPGGYAGALEGARHVVIEGHVPPSKTCGALLDGADVVNLLCVGSPEIGEGSGVTILGAGDAYDFWVWRLNSQLRRAS